MTEPANGGVLRSFLFVTFDGGGNLPPVLGLARRLVARGHTVRVLSEPCSREGVEKAGASFIPFQRHFTRTDRSKDLIGDAAAKTPLGALRRTFRSVVFAPARLVAEETLAAIHATRTDVVVVDVLMPGGLIAAEAAGIPRVSLFHMPEYLPGPGRPAAGPGFLPRRDVLGRVRDTLFTKAFLGEVGRFVHYVDEARRALGLAPAGTAAGVLDQYHSADLRLIQTSEAFDFPIEPRPLNVRYVGPVLDDPPWVGGWENPWPDDDGRPLVVASLSSTFQDQRGALGRIVAALGDLPVRGLVTLGPAMAAESFDLPENVVAVASAPHSALFPRATAVVTHGGHGTVVRALAYGLPLLCMPMGRDQDDNAARVEFHGAGLRLRPSVHRRRIASAIRRLLDEPGFAEGAGRLGERIRQDVAEDRALSELEGVARASRVATTERNGALAEVNPAAGREELFHPRGRRREGDG